MLKLKLQYFGDLMRRADSLEKSLILGKIEGRRKRGHQMMIWLENIILCEISQRRQRLYNITYMWNRKKNTNEIMCKRETDSQT